MYSGVRGAPRQQWLAVLTNLGLKAPRGYGWVTNPKKAAYKKIQTDLN